MKRLTCRAAAAIVGIVLGWYVAGIVFMGQPSVVPGLGTSYAQASDVRHDPHNNQAHTAEDSLDIDDTPGAHGDAGEDDPALAAAGQLVPQPHDIPWFGPVLWTAGGLFIAAVVLGIPALKLRGPEPPDPADTHSH